MIVARNNNNADDIIVIVFYSRNHQDTNFGYKHVTEAQALATKDGNTIWNWQCDGECNDNLLPYFASTTAIQSIDDFMITACLNQLKITNPPQFGHYTLEEI